jgi:GTP-binding protein HflX
MKPVPQIFHVDAREPDAAVVGQAAAMLRGGLVVAYPTDTVYGLAVDPRNPEAVRRLFALKGRAETSALTVIAADVAQAEAVGVWTAEAARLAARWWPGPLTIVVGAREGLAAGTLGGGRTVGVRVPDHPVARALAGAAGFCITATSANASGAPAAADAAGVRAALPQVDAVLDGGAALVGLFKDSPRHFDPEQALEELAGLAAAANAEVVLRVQQERARPDPATFVGKGKVETLAAAAAEARVDVVIFDNELSPAQLRNLEDALGRRVIDRTQLILDIFARRARTREGKLQVELAQLKYLMPRLVGSSDALSRQGGGIGTLGPGETKLETDRRRIRHRVSVVSKEIDTVRRRRAQLRERRHKAAVPTVALVGYTNAGKTTLFNALTGDHAVASNALFVTLDPLIRRVKLPDRRELLVSDTVGFIDRLPHSLVAAFRATLEEVAEADLLLHVIDASAPDRERHMAAVIAVLEEVGAHRVPTVDVFNKCDRLDAAERARLNALYPTGLCVSALNGDGRDEIVAVMETKLALDTATVTYSFDPHDAADRELIADLYRFGRILRHVTSDESVVVEAELPRRLLDRFSREEPRARA